MRLEKDTLGEKYLTDETVYGINTQRAVENFPLSHKKVNLHLIHAMLLVKKAAAKTYENLVEDIENSIMNSPSKEISSGELGNMVMDRLKNLDEVAYVRFASVYRQFKDINTFMDELNKLLDEKKN